MQGWRIPSLFSYSGDALERSYQRQYELPGHAFNISVLVGIVIKLIVLWNTLQKWTAPGAVVSLAQGLLALSLCLALPLLGVFHPSAFKKYWRELSAAHVFASGIHALSSGRVLFDSGACKQSGTASSANYIRAYLESSAAVPLLTMSIGASLPFTLHIATYSMILVIAARSNLGLCESMEALQGQESIQAAAAHALEMFANGCSTLLTGGMVDLAMPASLPCNVIMSVLQVLATLAATLLMCVLEVWSRRAYVLTPGTQHLLTPADRAAWAPANHGGAGWMFGSVAKGCLVSGCIAWHVLLVLFVDKSPSGLKGLRT